MAAGRKTHFTKERTLEALSPRFFSRPAHCVFTPTFFRRETVVFGPDAASN